MNIINSVRGALGGNEGESELSSSGQQMDVPRPATHGEPTPTTFRNKAVDARQRWRKYDLDFSIESVARLAELAEKQGAVLDVMASDTGNESAAEMHTGYTIYTGSYFGEVLVRELGGRWVRGTDGWMVSVPTGDDEMRVDVFRIAAHSFAEQPLFVETATELGADLASESGAEAAAAAEAEVEEVPEGNASPDIREQMRPEAEELAAFWDEYELDFTTASLSRLESLVETEWDSARFRDVEPGSDDMDSQMYMELIKQIGSYFGEVLVRGLNAEWGRRGEEVVVEVSAGSDGWIPVRIFDLAGDGLSGSPQFVSAYNDTIDRASLDRKPLSSTEPTPDTDHPDPEKERASSDPTDQPGTAAVTDQHVDTPVDDAHTQDKVSTDETSAVDVGEDETLDLSGGESAERTISVEDLHDDAEAFAATWPGYDLDYSPASLKQLDKLVREEYDVDEVPSVDLDGVARVTTDYLTARILETGGYFADVCQRSLGGEWNETGHGLELVIEGRNTEMCLDPVEIAADAFRGETSFVETYTNVRNQLSISPNQ